MQINIHEQLEINIEQSTDNMDMGEIELHI